jgi:hypothetical protein
MQVAHSGKFELPEDGVLVSAVYSLTHDLGDKELRHSVTLEMQHCANTSALKDLCVVRSIGVPCKFEIIPGGDFTHSDGYGVINLHRFSRYSILKRIRSFFSSSNDLDYCAKIYYTNILRHQFDFEFIIIRDLDTLAKAIEEKLRNRVSTFEYGPSSIVEFERNEISLDIPTSTCDGWSMKRLNTLLVRRKDVDRYTPDRSLVTCQVRVRWVGDVNKPVPLHYEIKLDGAKDVFTFLTVTSPIHYDDGATGCTQPTATGEAVPLSTDDLDEVLQILENVNKKWMELGLALGLKKPTLDNISADYHTVDERKREMLWCWLQMRDSCKATCNWKSLAEALKKQTVNHHPIAGAIQRKYTIY